MPQELGKGLIALGALLILVGVFFIFRDKIPGLSSLGKLPGDISVERENFRFYAPLGTSLLLSVVLSLLFWLFRSKS